VNQYRSGVAGDLSSILAYARARMKCGEGRYGVMGVRFWFGWRYYAVPVVSTTWHNRGRYRNLRWKRVGEP
jgi:hypothetical protein